MVGDGGHYCSSGSHHLYHVGTLFFFPLRNSTGRCGSGVHLQYIGHESEFFSPLSNSTGRCGSGVHLYIGHESEGAYRARVNLK